jgi:hypothetical protein
MKNLSLTSVLPLRGNTLYGIKNIWCEYVDTTIYPVTDLNKITLEG